jgi:hypothetical protein
LCVRIAAQGLGLLGEKRFEWQLLLLLLLLPHAVAAGRPGRAVTTAKIQRCCEVDQQRPPTIKTSTGLSRTDHPNIPISP